MPPARQAPIVIMTKPNVTHSTPYHSSHLLQCHPHSLSHSYNPSDSATSLMHNPYPNQMPSTSYNLLLASTSYQSSAYTDPPSWNNTSYGHSTFAQTPSAVPSHTLPSSYDLGPNPYRFVHSNPQNPY